jgi:hypothetical protein
MSTETIVQALEEQIERLTVARNLLVNGTRSGARANIRHHAIRQRRPMSEATKRKIGRMMKQRWLERRKKKMAAAA